MAKAHKTGKLVGLLALGGAALGGAWYAFWKRGSSTAAGVASGVTTGKSGAKWWIEHLGQQGSSTLSHGFRVYLVPPAEKNKPASAMIPVLEYIQLAPKADMSSAELVALKTGRTATKFFDATATSMNAAAMQDLGIAAAG